MLSRAISCCLSNIVHYIVHTYCTAQPITNRKLMRICDFLVLIRLTNSFIGTYVKKDRYVHLATFASIFIDISQHENVCMYVLRNA